MGVCEPEKFTRDLYYVFWLSQHFRVFWGVYGRGVVNVGCGLFFVLGVAGVVRLGP